MKDSLLFKPVAIVLCCLVLVSAPYLSESLKTRSCRGRIQHLFYKSGSSNLDMQIDIAAYIDEHMPMQVFNGFLLYPV